MANEPDEILEPAPVTTEPEPTPEPEPDPPPPPPPPPGRIVKAYDYGSYIELVVTHTGETEEQPFVLSPDDHYGDSDAWRFEYERALGAGEITLEPPPPVPAPLPAGT